MDREWKEGWTWLYNVTKWHYFVNGRSLCGKWGILSDKDLVQGLDDFSDNCKACQRKLRKRQKKRREERGEKHG